MNEQRQNDQLEPTYNSSVPIQDVALNTYRKRWTIEKGGVRESGRSALVARHDDDDIICIVFGKHVLNQTLLEGMGNNILIIDRFLTACQHVGDYSILRG